MSLSHSYQVNCAWWKPGVIKKQTTPPKTKTTAKTNQKTTHTQNRERDFDSVRYQLQTAAGKLKASRPAEHLSETKAI